MLTTNKIIDLAKAKNISIRSLAKKIDMTNNGLLNALDNNDFKLSTLRKIAEVLEVSVSYFFLDEQPGKSPGDNNNEIKELKLKIKYLEKELTLKNAECDNELKMLRMQVDHLEKELASKNEIIRLLKKH